MGNIWNAANSKLTSAIAGLELNDTIKYLEIMGAAPASHHSLSGPQPYALRSRAALSKAASGSSEPSSAQSQLAVRTGIPAPPHTEATAMFLATQRLTVAIPARSSGKQPQSAANLPGHINTLTTMARTAMPGISNITHDPQFAYAAFPSTTSYNSLAFDRISLTRTSFVFTDTPYDPDLIFSINLRPADVLTKGLYISEVQFKIPIGDPNLRKQPKPLAPSWEVISGLGLTPPGADWGNVRAKMLNNQRWIVHMDPEPTYMNIRIIPRSMLMAYPVAINRNMSFKLDEVPLAGADGKATQPGSVTIHVTEIYRRRQRDVADGLWASMGTADYEMTIFRRLTPVAH